MQLLGAVLTLLACATAFRTSSRSRKFTAVSATLTSFDADVYLAAKKKIVDAALDKSLSATDKNVEKIIESMRYSLLAGGKRVRPILCLVSNRKSKCIKSVII
jgi:geranylgeranyl diphosphate synthase type II